MYKLIVLKELEIVETGLCSAIMQLKMALIESEDIISPKLFYLNTLFHLISWSWAFPIIKSKYKIEFLHRIDIRCNNSIDQTLLINET